jgi:hypothetical protein
MHCLAVRQLEELVVLHSFPPPFHKFNKAVLSQSEIINQIELLWRVKQDGDSSNQLIN